MTATTTAPAKNGAVAKTNPKPAQPMTLRGYLQSPEFANQIAMALPSHMKPERMIRVAMTAITRTPQLAECEQASFFRCLLDLSQWGLEPDGRHAHLIPFQNRKRGVLECQLILDYKGLVQIAYRAGVKSIHADIVCKGDLFVYNRGDVEQHVPWFLRVDADKPAAPGDMIAAYCRIVLPGDAIKTEVMSVAEIDAIRGRSKAGSSGPWVTDYFEMAKKTVCRRASKWIPLSAEFRDALERDHDSFPAIDNTPRQLSPGPSTLDALTTQLAPAKPKPDVPDELPPPPTDTDYLGESVSDSEVNGMMFDADVDDGIAESIAKLQWSKARADSMISGHVKKTHNLNGLSECSTEQKREVLTWLEGQMERS